MTIICVFAQRSCDYPGQYAPELIGAIDELGDSENPDYLNDIEDKARDDKYLSVVKRLRITIPDADFNKAFFEAPSIPGTVGPA